MSTEELLGIHRYHKGQLKATGRSLVAEYPLLLNVNGQDLATLIGSPHQLDYLVLGFLRLQGIIHTMEDVRLIGVCSQDGAARVDIRGELPQALTPTLTSGCGAGISFNLELEPLAHKADERSYTPEAVFELMRQLGLRSERYRRHGGLHSAAVGRGNELVLYAEDLGRHNTLDRIAGEALVKGIDLSNLMLVTSGRISTEMVAKAARLQVGLIASRTSPTRAAVELAQQAGITLIGYLRGEGFEVYTHAAQLLLLQEEGLIPATTGVILAGGASRRMGSDKSLLPLDGERFIERSYQRMAELFDEVLIVTNSPQLYADIPCRKVKDIYPGKGALGGIHSGLFHARQAQIFVVACDMPFLQPELIRNICQENHKDVLIPRTRDGLEPLHACYRKSCLPAIEAVLKRDSRRIIDFFPAVDVAELPPSSWERLDPQGLSFRNINTPEDYFSLREVHPQPGEKILQSLAEE